MGPTATAAFGFNFTALDFYDFTVRGDRAANDLLGPLSVTPVRAVGCACTVCVGLEGSLDYLGLALGS